MNISGHAIRRMEERGFSLEMLNKFLAGEVFDKDSEKEKDVVLLVGEINGKFWTLVVNHSTNNLITVRRSHKKEIIDYVSGRH